jgi:hypothetical protein
VPGSLVANSGIPQPRDDAGKRRIPEFGRRLGALN